MNSIKAAIKNIQRHVVRTGEYVIGTDTSPNGLPRITVGYMSRPSWRNYGSGYRRGEITAERDGSLYCIFSEHPENGRGGKEVFITLPAEVVAAIRDPKFFERVTTATV